jgi:hypothetical protein
MKQDFELMTARLFHHKRPAIVPGMEITSGNKLLASRLWESLYHRYSIGGTTDQVAAIATWYVQRHPTKLETCIIPVVAHFQLLMGIDVTTDEEYITAIDQRNQFAEVA